MKKGGAVKAKSKAEDKPNKKSGTVAKGWGKARGARATKYY
jgi:hypothetical protein